MRHIIQELMQPMQMPDGSIRHPTNIMRKAGETMMKMNEMWEQDRAGRSKSQALCDDLLDQVHKLEEKIVKYEVTHDLSAAKLEYQAMMNEDYDLDYPFLH